MGEVNSVHKNVTFPTLIVTGEQFSKTEYFDCDRVSQSNKIIHFLL